MELSQAFEQFVRNGLYLRGWSKRTVRTYRQGFSSFQQSLHGAQRAGIEPAAVSTGEADFGSPDILTKARLEAWVISLREKGLTPGGINMYIRTINSFLSWLKEEKHIPDSLKVKLLPNPSKPLKGFSDFEIRSLLSFRPRGFTEVRTWTLISTLLDTGCRIEELLTLQTKNTDMDNLVIKITGKGNKTRLVPLSLELRKTLFKFGQSRDCNPNRIFFFSTRAGHRLSYRNCYRDIKTLSAKAGVEGEHVHPHAFRHCFAVTYIRRGGDIYRLSRILGHSSISTTQIYLRSMGIEHIGENHSSLSPLSRQA